MWNLKVGQAAPDFKAPAYVAGQFKDVSLKDYKGKWVCLFFYPLDFTFVCPTEIRSFAQNEKNFLEANCQVIACSTDSQHSRRESSASVFGPSVNSPRRARSRQC